MIKDEVIQGEWKMVCYVHRLKLMRHYEIWIEPHSLLLWPQPASNCCSLTCLISLGYCCLCCFIFQEFLSANSGVFYGCSLAAEGDIHHHHEPLISVGIRKRTATWILKQNNRVGIFSRCGRLCSSSQLHFLDETFNWLIRWHILSSSALLGDSGVASAAFALAVQSDQQSISSVKDFVCGCGKDNELNVPLRLGENGREKYNSGESLGN